MPSQVKLPGVHERGALGGVEEDVVKRGIDIDGKSGMHNHLVRETGCLGKSDARLNIPIARIDVREGRGRKRQGRVPEWIEGRSAAATL